MHKIHPLRVEHRQEHKRCNKRHDKEHVRDSDFVRQRNPRDKVHEEHDHRRIQNPVETHAERTRYIVMHRLQQKIRCFYDRNNECSESFTYRSLRTWSMISVLVSAPCFSRTARMTSFTTPGV